MDCSCNHILQGLARGHIILLTFMLTSEHYIGFLGLFACAYHVIDLAATEIYMDKVRDYAYISM